MHQNSDPLEPELELNCPSFNAYSTTASNAAATTDPDPDFEFQLTSPVPDQIFPHFNRNLIFSPDILVDYRTETDSLPLYKHFLDDSSSSSDDELHTLPPETYCVWRPPAPAPAPACGKSNSTGTLRDAAKKKKWRVMDLMMRRSKSDGKESFAYLKREKDKETKSGKTRTAVSSSSVEMFYVNKKVKESEKRRQTYLPYRPDLVGFFGNGYGNVRIG